MNSNNSLTNYSSAVSSVNTKLTALIESTRQFLDLMKTRVRTPLTSTSKPVHKDDIRNKPVPGWPDRRSYIRR